MDGIMSLELTRTELVALKETIELSPGFEGRTEARNAIRLVLHQRQSKPAPLCLEETILGALVRRIIPIDVQSAALRFKLSRELKRASLG